MFAAAYDRSLVASHAAHFAAGRPFFSATDAGHPLTEEFDDATYKANHGIPGRWRAPQPSLATWQDWQADALTEVSGDWCVQWGPHTVRLCVELEASRIAELEGKPFASPAAARRWARFGKTYCTHRVRALDAFADAAGYEL